MKGEPSHEPALETSWNPDLEEEPGVRYRVEKRHGAPILFANGILSVNGRCVDTTRSDRDVSGFTALAWSVAVFAWFLFAALTWFLGGSPVTARVLAALGVVCVAGTVVVRRPVEGPAAPGRDVPAMVAGAVMGVSVVGGFVVAAVSTGLTP